MPNQWRLYVQATLKIEQRFVPRFERIITSYRDQFINDIETSGKDYAVSQMLTRPAHDDLVPIMRLLYRVSGLVGARMTVQEITAYVRRKAANNGMHVKSGAMGRSEQWVRDVMNYLQTHMLRLIQRITETMREDILNILQKSADEGWGLSETIRVLRERGLIRSRAQVIARTEINRAGNAGHAAGARSLPYEVNKKWLGAADHRERHSHILTNNHTVDELGTFEVPVFKGKVQIGMDHMQFPGDPNAHVSNTANCRCRVLYEPKRDANGRLIMREVNIAPVVPMGQPTTYTPAQIAAELKSHMVIEVK